MRRIRETVVGVCALCAVATAAPVAAQGGLISTSTCDSTEVSQPFAPWGDDFFYELVPGGDFSKSAWTLSGGAERVREPFTVTGLDGGSVSLSLTEGALAESPPVCVTAAYPTIRFFIAGTGTAAVDVVYGGVTIPSGVVVAAGEWQPTPVMITGSAVTGALAGGTAQVSVQLTGITGDPQIDDVFIDPWNRG